MKSIKKFIKKTSDIYCKVNDEKMNIILVLDKDAGLLMSKTKFNCPMIEDGFYHLDVPSYSKMVAKNIKLINDFTIIFDKVENGVEYYLATDIGNKYQVKPVAIKLDNYDDKVYTSNKVSRQFLEDLKNSVTCSSCDWNRYFMRSVYIDNDRSTLAATDGRRLCTYKYEDKLDMKYNKNNTALLKKEWVKRIEEKKDSYMLFSEHYVAIVNDDYYFWNTYVEGQFPNYTKVIPEYDTLTLSSVDFSLLENYPKDIVNRVTFTKDDFQFMDLNKVPGHLLPLIDDMKVSFNKDFLVDLWRMNGKKEVVMNVSFNQNDTTRAWKFEDGHFTYVVMPMNFED